MSTKQPIDWRKVWRIFIDVCTIFTTIVMTFLFVVAVIVVAKT